MAQFQNFSLCGSEKLSIKVVELDFKAGMEEYGLCYAGIFIWEKPMNVKTYRAVMCQMDESRQITYINHIHADHMEKSIPCRKQHGHHAAVVNRKKKQAAYGLVQQQYRQPSSPPIQAYCSSNSRRLEE
ncbi:hypothetical protein M9H77_13430 [Catharanthus roseus]|uniref:Uncharacterized protein n=1 Tax=Catharanthus roseus TaxID=4058 RepID=A0ACC0BK70_CATRO|nr:hypothetical protein M9H77_13430 [Catharanthus roseus]